MAGGGNVKIVVVGQLIDYGPIRSTGGAGGNAVLVFPPKDDR